MSTPLPSPLPLTPPPITPTWSKWEPAGADKQSAKVTMTCPDGIVRTFKVTVRSADSDQLTKLTDDVAQKCFEKLASAFRIGEHVQKVIVTKDSVKAEKMDGNELVEKDIPKTIIADINKAVTEVQGILKEPSIVTGARAANVGATILITAQPQMPSPAQGSQHTHIPQQPAGPAQSLAHVTAAHTTHTQHGPSKPSAATALPAASPQTTLPSQPAQSVAASAVTNVAGQPPISQPHMGTGSPASPSVATAQRAITQQDAQSALEQGRKFLSNGNVQKASESLHQAATWGNSEAMVEIANMFGNKKIQAVYYKNAKLQKPNRAESTELQREWLLRSASLGNPKAYIALALFYQKESAESFFTKEKLKLQAKSDFYNKCIPRASENPVQLKHVLKDKAIPEEVKNELQEARQWVSDYVRLPITVQDIQDTMHSYSTDLTPIEKRALKITLPSDDRVSITFTEHPGFNVSVRREDIFKSGAEVIVNAANTDLGGGGGIDGAIHTKGGRAYEQAHKQLQAKYNSNYTSGYAAMIDSGDLRRIENIDNIIVVAGPKPKSPTPSAKEEDQLYSCYYNSLLLAHSQNKESIAIPSISTGIYNFNKDRATAISLKAIKDFISKHSGKTPENGGTTLKNISIHIWTPGDKIADISADRADLLQYKAAVQSQV